MNVCSDNLRGNSGQGAATMALLIGETYNCLAQLSTEKNGLDQTRPVIKKIKGTAIRLVRAGRSYSWPQKPILKSSAICFCAGGMRSGG